ncbi:MAG: SDR family oxidoreductase [Planctomycetes bacterium]|nr:SDR family oxidoreductase [Planctomycetota bacterium]
MELEGRTVIVTGAGSGIGRALAREFGRNSARVVCCARRKARLDETVKLIEEEGGVGVAIPTDITDHIQVKQMVEEVLDRFGSIDVVFNNAGSFQSIAGVHEVDPDVWWQDVTVNLYGPLLILREVLPHMMSRNEGIIINMNGGRPVGGTGYACGKAGLMELTRILAEELKMQDSAVMVFSAGPGLVRTEMTELQATTEAGRRWIPSTKDSFDSGKTRAPEEVAVATIKMIQVARPESSGKSYGPATDFTDF